MRKLAVRLLHRGIVYTWNLSQEVFMSPYQVQGVLPERSLAHVDFMIKVLLSRLAHRETTDSLANSDMLSSLWLYIDSLWFA